ncbi:hypothetical protein C4580_04265 [Candidatus Woesearchaeota archaeon]|nr:MAG: hypothetical protein C4580_04265 [Candidatus Woesearchaeota archaeon]
MYRIFHGARFAKQYAKIDGHYHPLIERFELRLRTDPHIGKPLGNHFLREKKFSGLRLHFLTYPDLKKIIFIALGNKRDQKEIIAFIKEHLQAFKKLAEKL